MRRVRNKSSIPVKIRWIRHRRSYVFVQEPDLQNSLDVLYAVRHARIAGHVAHENNVFPSVQHVEVLVIDGMLVLVEDVNQFRAFEAGQFLSVVGQKVRYYLDVVEESVVDFQNGADHVAESGAENQNRDLGGVQTLDELFAAVSQSPTVALRHNLELLGIEFEALEHVTRGRHPLFHRRYFRVYRDIRIFLDRAILRV